MRKYRAGIIGATGMVGQRFITLLKDHPWFEITALAASARSSGKKYTEAVEGRWKLNEAIPDKVKDMIVKDANNIDLIKKDVDFVFCAIELDKEETKKIEEAYAKAEIPLVSNNSAARWIEDTPMLIPEINHAHLDIIDVQRKRLGVKKGFIAVKPNCSIQSYVPALTPLMAHGVKEVAVCTYQAISGAGKNFKDWPEMIDNVIPYIGGEEEKSEQEPLKVWGKIDGGAIIPAESPAITSQCIRVPATDGHMAAVFMAFQNKPDIGEVISIWREFKGRPQELSLPSAPKQFLHYFEEDNRPQTGLDRMLENGMAVSLGRLRPDSQYDYRFIGLSHNTLRGAAGGAVLLAELLCAEDFI